jgi:hypothetical protein
MPVEKKMALANYVIWSEGGLDVLEIQLYRVLGKITSCPSLVV